MATKLDLQINEGVRLSGRFSLRARLLLLIIGVASTLVTCDPSEALVIEFSEHVVILRGIRLA